jgi:hypothetical protein
VQARADWVGVYVPAAHSPHTLLLEPEANVPSAHGEQKPADPWELVNDPAAHAVQARPAVPVRNVPRSHSWQAWAAVAVW